MEQICQNCKFYYQHTTYDGEPDNNGECSGLPRQLNPTSRGPEWLLPEMNPSETCSLWQSKENKKGNPDETNL